MDSILTSIKKLLGIAEAQTDFDQDIIMHINTVLMTLNQLGVGPKEVFSITDETDVWSDFLDEDTSIEGVKTYIYMKVKMIFDPPQSSAMAEALNKNIAELEWRLNVAAS